MLLALVSLTIVLVHIALAPPKRKTGLEFWIIDLPDSLMELIITAIVAIQVERVALMVYDFVRARYWQCKSCGSPIYALYMKCQHSLEIAPEFL